MDQRPQSQRFGINQLEQIAKAAASGPLTDNSIDDVNNFFGPMLQLATAYHGLPELGSESSHPNYPTVEPEFFRSDLATVKSAFESGFRKRISNGGEEFTVDEIAIMKSIERADFSFANAKSDARKQWDRALDGDGRKPHNQNLFVSKMMSKFNGREPECERVSVKIDHTMGHNPS